MVIPALLNMKAPVLMLRINMQYPLYDNDVPHKRLIEAGPVEASKALSSLFSDAGAFCGALQITCERKRTKPL